MLDGFAAQPARSRAWGEVLVTSMVTIFKDKFDTHENIGFASISGSRCATAYWMS